MSVSTCLSITVGSQNKPPNLLMIINRLGTLYGLLPTSRTIDASIFVRSFYFNCPNLINVSLKLLFLSQKMGKVSLLVCDNHFAYLWKFYLQYSACRSLSRISVPVTLHRSNHGQYVWANWIKNIKLSADAMPLTSVESPIQMSKMGEPSAAVTYCSSSVDWMDTRSAPCSTQSCLAPDQLFQVSEFSL